MSAKFSFSWIVLLLGFSLIAITLQGVQGGAENEGPTEVDCMPYIEKALKEKAVGDTAEKEPSEKNESAEDFPTVEITDDTSAQETDDADDDNDATPHDENEPETDAASAESAEQAQDDETQKTEDTKKSEEDIDEKSIEHTPSKEASKSNEEANGQASQEEEDKSEEKAESTEDKKDSKESIEKIGKPEESEEFETDHKQTKSVEQSIEQGNSQEEVNTLDIPVSKKSIQVTKSKESLEVETKESKKGSKEKEESLRQGSRDSNESHEDPTSKEKSGCPPSNEVNCKDGGARCNKHRHCGEGEICCLNKCYQRKCIPGTPTSEELAEEGSEESEEQKESVEESAEKVKSASHTGCPGMDQVPCKEGPRCGKHKQCGEGKICCPNKCYQRKCIEGTPTEEDLAGEESEEESKEEEKSAEQKPKTPLTGCPGAGEVPCKEGETCSKHRHCPDGKICCTNKCYRKRCVSGEATSEELTAEEESAEEDVKEETKSAERLPRASESTGCPQSSDLACGKGAPCGKHRHCDDGEICCVNKCYRKTCTPGTPTEADLAAEGSEESEEEKVEEGKSAEETSHATKSGCPGADKVSCTEGDLCSKHRHCGSGKICCANKCYRKRCVTGEATEEELAAEEGQESEEEKEESDEVLASEEGDGCPTPDKVPCTGAQRCAEDEECDQGEICCTNKCYNKRCIPGTPKESVEKVKVVTKESREEKRPEPEESVEEIEAAVSAETKEAVSVEEPVQKAPPPPPARAAPIVPLKEKPAPQPVVKKTSPPPPPPKVETKPPPPKVEVKAKVEEPAKKEVKKPERVARSVEESSIETGGVDAVEELLLDYEIPSNLRSRNHVEQLLKLESTTPEKDTVQHQVYEETLKELKKLYEQAIKPLETLYKYRDLSNRHFGDAEIFSKPLVLFMGPWSGGKSSIINYLVNNEYNVTSLRTGAEPSPAYFNLLMYGEEPQIVDGTELAADFTFSGLQKFGQGLEERLRGVKLPSKLLEKVNIVEIPGILEVRKQVSRVFPFNDACQWFIDRADIIFLVYDPAKLDVGPETEAILDQLKGREHQTRIILNKADQVKPEELMRVQGALIWNISPLMSSPHPPVMYTTSLWSRPYEPGAPMRLLQAQERAFLRDLRTAVDNRVEHKISSARRFAVRVRNHAKMVDCYLTTYYNHKSVFGNKNKVANEIIDHPQNYHIYEGLSTLTNISRYDLPDPEAYRDFFRLNPLYEFQPLSATCTYFRGCPINRLDIAIAYDFPELLGTYKRNLEKALHDAASPPQETSAQKKNNKKSKS